MSPPLQGSSGRRDQACAEHCTGLVQVVAAPGCTSSAAPSPSHARPRAPTCSAPTVTASPINAVSATVTVTPTRTGQRWAFYTLEVCIKSARPPQCFLTQCTAEADRDAPTECLIEGLEGRTTYTVTAIATALRGKATSRESLPFTFTTPPHV